MKMYNIYATLCPYSNIEGQEIPTEEEIEEEQYEEEPENAEFRSTLKSASTQED